MKSIPIILVSLVSVAVSAGASKPNHTYRHSGMAIQEVPFTRVHLSDHFWSPRIEINRTVSILPLSGNVRKRTFR